MSNSLRIHDRSFWPQPWSDLVGVFGQKANLPDQMGPAELNQHLTIRHVLVVRREVVRPDDAPEGLGQDRLEHLRATRRVDMKNGEVRGAKTPRPELLAAVFVSGLIHADVRLLDQGLAKFGIGLCEGRRGLLDDVDQLRRG